MKGIDFNKDWKFKLNELAMFVKNSVADDCIEGAHLLETDDSSWRSLSLPHDWSREFERQPEYYGCTGFFPGGMAWYRKTFTTNEDMVGNKVFINFDGIYNRATIYCNGEFVTFHPYGYSPCLVDITEFLNSKGEENLIAVRVDHTRYADSRWYTGSGIYRKVSLHILPEIHIPVWGTFFQTPEIKDDVAKISANVRVNNTTNQKKKVKVAFEVTAPNGEVVADKFSETMIYGNSEIEIDSTIFVKDPILWEILDSKLYSVSTKLYVDEILKQEQITKIGIRYFHFDTDKGFFFNGKHTLIKGVCLHHDAGLVGAAVPKDVWRRRLESLIECGCNAIRLSHNPSSEDFLDLCDEYGLLVQSEFFDEWDNAKDKVYNGGESKSAASYPTKGHVEYFQRFAESDLKNSMLRDRNHPSIFQWSIGNEIEWTYRKYNDACGFATANAAGGYFFTAPPLAKEETRRRIRALPKDDYEIGETAKKLADWTREMDKSRPVVSNCIFPCASYESGLSDVLDIVGYSYRRIEYDYGHTNYPDKPIMGTENLVQWHEWKAVLENEFISGIFLWIGIDYLGEAQGEKAWPLRGMNVGMFDYACFPKPSYYMYRSLWNESPMVHIATQTLEKSLYKKDENAEIVEKEKGNWERMRWYWQDVNPYWDYQDGEDIAVEVYTNCEEVQLSLNGEVISTKYLKDQEDRIIKWVIPYAKGELKAIAKKGSEVVEYALKTNNEFGSIRLTADKDTLNVDSDSAIHIIAEIFDENQNPLRTDDQNIQFEFTGPYINRGVDNGHGYNNHVFDSDKIETSFGKALMIVQASDLGEITIVAKSGDKISNVISINVI